MIFPMEGEVILTPKMKAIRAKYFQDFDSGPRSRSSSIIT